MNGNRDNVENTPYTGQLPDEAEAAGMAHNRTDSGRRKFLAGIGVAGAALAAGGWIRGAVPSAYAQGGPVTESVYGPPHGGGGRCRPDWIDVRCHGAAGDGATDDTAAIQAALDAAAGRNVHFPAGIYRITSTLSAPLVRLVGEGSGRTTLMFDQMAGLDGIVFQAESIVGKEGGVEHMTLMTRGAHGRYAIATPADSSLYYTYRTRYFFTGLEFRGDVLQNVSSGFVYDYGWENYIRLGDCWGAYIEDIDAIGVYLTSSDPQAQPDHTFLTMTAGGGALSVRISKVTTHGVKRGIEIGNRVFFFISHVDIAHSYEGIVSTGTTVFSEGRIHDTLVNAQKVGVFLNNRSWTAIHNVAIGRHKSGYDHGGDWYGIKLENVGKSWIGNIRVQADTSVTVFTGTSYGFHFTSSNGLTLDGLIPGLGLHYGIYLYNCAQHVYDGLNFQGTSGTGISFQTNSRDIIVGPHVFSNGWTKYEFGTVDRSRLSIVQKDMQLESKQPFLVMRETDGATDGKHWRMTVNNGSLNRQILNDSDGGAVDYELVQRTGASVDGIEWRADTLYMNGTAVRTNDLQPAVDNAYTLGSATNRWSEIYSATPVIVTSDVRDKANVRDSELGLAFIEALRPVSYTLQATGRPHYGLIAQEVKGALGSLGVDDFAGWTEDRTTGKQGLRYEEFVAPLIKAVQELSAEVRRLEAERS
jgi:hypothetical protein